MASRDSVSCAKLRLAQRDKAVLAFGLALALSLAVSLGAQTTPAMARPPAAQGFKVPGVVHGSITVKGAVQRGAAVTVTSAVTGQKYSAFSDSLGAYSIAVPRTGPYFVSVQFGNFPPLGREVVVNSVAYDQRADFSLINDGSGTESPVGLQSLYPMWPPSELSPLSTSGTNFNSNVQLQTSSTINFANVAVPAFVGDPQFSSTAFSIDGQGAAASPYVAMSALMEGAFESGPTVQNGIPPGGNSPTGYGELAILSNSQNSQSLHGMVYWDGGNSALNARPFLLAGQPIPNPSYYSNGYGMVLTGQPFLPRLLKPSPRDFFLFTFAGQQSKTLVNDYGVVPTELEREGNFSQLTGPTGGLIPIYPLGRSTPFPGNIITTPLDPIAQKLLQYIPEPNVQGSSLNYHLLTTQEIHGYTLGLRYQHGFGAPASSSGQLATTSSGSFNRYLNLNFLLNHLDSEIVNLFPILGGEELTPGYSFTGSYMFGNTKRISIVNLTSNRSDFQIHNLFTGKEDVATELGFQGIMPNVPVNSNSFNYGFPSFVFSGFSGFTQTQPASILTQSIALSSVTAWSLGSHTIRVGGDFRRIELNLFGGSNATGTLIFSGLYSQQPGTSGSQQVAPSGSALADFLQSYPGETTIESPNQKYYMRQNDWQAGVRDDWRALPNLTLFAGLRYNSYSPFAEKYDRLATLDYTPTSPYPVQVFPYGTGYNSGEKYPRTLVEPERNNFSPHVGFAWQPRMNTVVRGGYGIYYTVGQYGSFIQNLGYQPPFANVQANGNGIYEYSNNGGPPEYAVFTSTENAFVNQGGDGNYAINRNYRLPYIQVWFADVERVLPLQIVVDATYTGSKGTRLDAITAPGSFNQDGIPILFFDYENSVAFSNYNALVLTATKRLQNGLAFGAVYTYSHAIDDASSINAASPVVAQNPDDVLAEEGNSNFDIRHQLFGSFLYELPFGPNMPYLNGANWLSHALGDWSLAGTFAVATGLPITPNIAASAAEVERGTHGSVRPNRVPGISITAGGGHLNQWFNTAAFSTDFADGQLYGNASRNSIPGPGLINIGLSLSKTLLFNDTRSLELRATANNALNNVQYGTVNAQFDSPTVGQVTSTQSMRQLTFLARFRF